MKKCKAAFLMLLLSGLLTVPVRADIALGPARNGNILYDILLIVAAVVVVALVIWSVRRRRQGK